LQPIFATVDAVADFPDQFTRLESENVQLRKAIKTSADQVLEANMLTAEAQNENILLKDELKKLKKKMKDEQEARHEASILVDEKEGALRESIISLLSKVPSHFAWYSFNNILLVSYSQFLQILSICLSTVQASFERIQCRMPLCFLPTPANKFMFFCRRPRGLYRSCFR
jgi:uncharacterized protein YacL (UPF0231 family)